MGIVAVLIGIVFEVESHWLTNGERTAGKAALAQVEELEKLINCGCDRFAEVNKQAKASVAVADQKAWTIRDRAVFVTLSIYLGELEMAHDDVLLDMQVKRFVQERHLPLHSNPDLEAQSQAIQLQIYSMCRTTLHKFLD